MNETIKEALKKIYDKLTDEQKEKWESCKTEDEFMAFLGEIGAELPDELVDHVAGGLGGLGWTGPDGAHPWCTVGYT